MRIDRIELDNYRQYPKETITLPSGDSGAILVVIGHTGAGKTNLMNAIFWCLHGDEPHLTAADQALPMFNVGRLDEGEKPSPQTVRVSLHLTTSDGQNARVHREAVCAQSSDGNWSCRTAGPTVQLRTSEGWIDETVPGLWIDTHFPKNISPFFLFDGERMDELFRSAAALHVQDAVRQIAQLEPLDRLARHLEDMQKESRKHPANADPEGPLAQAAAVLEDETSKLGAMKQARETLLQGQQDLRRQYDELRGRRVDLPDQESFEKARELDAKLGETHGMIAETEKAFYMWVGEIAPFVFGYDAIAQLLDRVADAEERQVMPPPVKQEKLEQLLRAKTCLCKRELVPGTEPFHAIEVLRDKGLDVGPEAEVLGYLEPPARMARESVLECRQEWEQRSEEIRRLRAREEGINKQLRELQNKLRHHDEEAVRRLQEDWDLCVEELENVAAQIAKIDGDIERQKRCCEQAERDYEKLLDLEGAHQEHKERYRFISECRGAAQRTYDVLDTETRSRVATAMAANFLQLLSSRKAGSTYIGVDIDDNYCVRVRHAKSSKASGSLSQGERECLALAFSFALNEVTGFELPFVIDTPLGRLDPEVRVKAATKMVEQAQDRQVVIFFQPSEYPEDVQQVLRQHPLEVIDLEFCAPEQVTKLIRRS